LHWGCQQKTTALWILNPKMNEVPIKKETTARIFPVIAGTITIGSPRVVCGCCCCCGCCAAAVFIDTNKVAIKKLNNKKQKGCIVFARRRTTMVS
jgi:hypothetical protein